MDTLFEEGLEEFLEKLTEVNMRDASITARTFDEFDEIEKAQKDGYNHNPRPQAVSCMTAQFSLGMAGMCFRMIEEMKSGNRIMEEDLESFATRLLAEIDETYPPITATVEVREVYVMDNSISINFTNASNALGITLPLSAKDKVCEGDTLTLFYADVGRQVAVRVMKGDEMLPSFQ